MTADPTPPHRGTAQSFIEFVTMMAAVMALQAFAIDAMLPALPQIATDFGASSPNQLQWVVTAFIMGAGAGQLVYGPLSDAYGRRRVLLAGLGIYVVLSVGAALASSLSSLITLRVVQGIAAAAASVVPRSIVRDRFEGAPMSRVLSIIFMVFLLVPVVAPTVGQLLLMIASWRWIFAVLGLFGAIVALWIALRLPETLRPEHRRAAQLRPLIEAAAFVVTDRTSLCYTLAVTSCFGGLLAYVSTVSQIFSITFQRPGYIGVGFAACAGTMGISAYMNSRLVERLGTRRISHAALLAFLAVTLTHALIALRFDEGMGTFVFLQAMTLGSFGLCVSNFGAIAMQPMGSIAGTAASIQGLVSMLGGALIASAIGQQWRGSVLFLPAGEFATGAVAFALVLCAERGTLFGRDRARPHRAFGARTEAG